MRSFHLTIGMDVRIAASTEFTQRLRKDAQAEDASEFLKQAQQKYPDDDEEFTLFVVKHGVRRAARYGIADLCAQTGVGCTMSPARVQDVTPVVLDVPSNRSTSSIH